MKFKQTALTLMLMNCFIATSAYAAPLLTHDPVTTEKRIEKSNAWVEVSASAVEYNINLLKSKLTPGTKICGIIKADSYGHSVDLMMPILMKAQIPCLGFASNEEARIARSHGYKGILMRVRMASPSEIKDATQYNVTELVGNLKNAEEIAAIAGTIKRPINVHIAINANGLSRNGLELATESGRQDALAITKIKNIKITGLMTHYPVEDDDDVKKNLALFKPQYEWLIKEAKLNRKGLTIHSANSFATLEVPESHLDMVRVGGIIYGDTVPSHNFERAMTFKTKVAAVNTYPKGNTVGYDRTVTLKRDSRLANLPVGYSDGYRRSFSNKGFVLINGHKVPVMGKISMNTTMVDVTDFPDIKIGDEVVLFGKQKGAEITQDDIENIIDAAFGDIYTMWGNSNPKVLMTK